jgi:stage V sporulation protein B
MFLQSCYQFSGWPEETYISILGLSLTPFLFHIWQLQRILPRHADDDAYFFVSDIESLFRVIVGVGLAYFLMNTKGVAWAAGGASFGATAGALAGGILISIIYKLYKRKGRTVLNMPGIKETEKTSKLVKTLFAIAIPASLASVVVSIMNMINSVTVARCLQSAGLDLITATELWGQLSQKVQTLINVPMMVGVGLAAALVPAISESFARKNYNEIGDKTALALRFVMIIGIPSMIGLSVLSDPIIKLLFGADSGGGMMLKFLAFECVTSVAYINVRRYCREWVK